MALVMRLRRLGARHQPHFRISVAESATRNDSCFIEEIGWYDPQKPGINSKVDVERAKHWLSMGATPSDTVRSILKRHDVYGTAPPRPAEEPAAAEEPAPAEKPAPAEEAAPAPAEEPAAKAEEPTPEPPAEPEAAAQPEPAVEPEAPAEPEAPEPPPEKTE